MYGDYGFISAADMPLLIVSILIIIVSKKFMNHAINMFSATSSGKQYHCIDHCSLMHIHVHT